MKLEISDLLDLHNSALPYFTEKWLVGEENERFKKGDHWSEEQKNKAKNRRRQSYSMAATTTKLNIISATQRQARTSWKIVANVDPSDELKAELATIRLNDIERKSKYRYLESEVFDSGLGVLYGCIEVYLDYDNFEPEIKLKALDYRNVVWDQNSTEYELTDALWLAKRERLYRFELKAQYGSIIDKISQTSDAFGRDSSYFFTQSATGNPDFDILTKFTHYQKVSRNYYYVIFPDTKNLIGGMQVVKYRTKKQAEENLRLMNGIYLAQGYDWEGTIQKKSDIAYDQYVFAGNEILESNETDYPSPPIKVYRCFHYENDFWTFMDLLKSPQRFFDRIIAQIDYSFGVDIKTAYQLNVNALANNETPESAKLKLEETGGVVYTKSNEDVLKAIRSQGINPQWIQVMTIMQQFIEDFAGGRSFQGLSEGSGESGKAINLKKQQGSLITYLMLDNLSRWKQNLGEFILWMVKNYDTAEHQIKILGDSISPEMLELLKRNNIVTPSVLENQHFVTINKGGINYLKDAELELTVTEAALTEYEKESRFMKLMEFGRNVPQISTLPTYLKLLLDSEPNISSNDRNALIQELKTRVQTEDNINQQKINIEKARVLQDGLRRKDGNTSAGQ